MRTCTRTACGRPAAATLTYVYADSTAVLGPLAQHAEPHSYDLCPEHAERLTAPRGWEIVRLTPVFTPAPPSHDDLVALAEAVREVGRRPEPAPEPLWPAPGAAAGAATAVATAPGTRRAHLRVVRERAADPVRHPEALHPDALLPDPLLPDPLLPDPRPSDGV